MRLADVDLADVSGLVRHLVVRSASLAGSSATGSGVAQFVEVAATDDDAFSFGSEEARGGGGGEDSGDKRRARRRLVRRCAHVLDLARRASDGVTSVVWHSDARVDGGAPLLLVGAPPRLGVSPSPDSLLLLATLAPLATKQDASAVAVKLKAALARVGGELFF